MVGLADLGDVAWNCEQVFNKWLKDEKPATAGLLGFIEQTSTAFSAWVEALKVNSASHVDGADIARMAEMLKNGEEPTTAPPADSIIVPTPALDATTTEPAEPAAVSTHNLLEDLRTPTFEPLPAPVAELAEPKPPLDVETALPELDDLEIPAAEVKDEVVGPLPALEAFVPPPVVPIEPPDVRVGSVLVPHALFNIYLGEAAQHIATLDNEMTTLEARPLQPLSHEFMRAAHTLTSSSRTTNFDMIADVAAMLEKWSHDVIEFSPALDAHRLSVMRQAVDALSSMVMGLHTHELPTQRDDVVRELMQLRETLKLAKRAESTYIREPAPPFIASIPEKSVADAPVVATLAALPVMPASVEPAFESGKEKRRIEDDIDVDLMPIFIEEAKEIVPQVGNGLRTWRSVPADHTPVIELARHFHTLKGSARMAGLMRLGELAHVIETKMIAMDRQATPATAMFDDIDEYFDRFTGALDTLQAGEQPGLLIDVPVADVFEHQKDKPAIIAVMAAAAQAVRDEAAPDGRERQSLLRVNADIIDRFVNEAGEMSIARSRIDQEMLTFKQSLVELTENISRMKLQLREVEIQTESQIQSRIKEAEERGAAFDPLEFDRFSRTQELTRFMAESLNDVITLQLSLQKNLDETEAALIQQARLNRDLQQGLMGVRLVPLGNLQDRFYRVVRQTAKDLSKKANLEFRGVRVEIDRSVLEKITPPFEHLLRNAVAHGLEVPSDRVAKGKSEIGEITIDAQQVGNEVVLTLSDDGGGLNFTRIREKAIEHGLLTKDAEVTEAQLTQYIFLAGFSTASEITQVSGRGVGMDVVRNEIVSLGGRIDIASTTGRGTVFTIALPLTLAVTQAVMVVVGDVQYAIPSVMIEQVQEYKGKRYEPLLEMSEIDWNGNKYPLRSMAALLGGKPTVSAQRRASVILAKSGQQRAAVQVDQIIGNREIVVKSIGPQLARLVGVAGATVTGAGQIILIINPVQLHFRETATVRVEDAKGAKAASVIASSRIDDTGTSALQPLEEAKGPSLGEAIAAAMPAGGELTAAPLLVRTVPLVMVVDDSLTVRKITSRMLTREGFDFATAKDGVDGLQQLQDIEPDIILLDIEMPRMDGFEFARNVRADAKTKNIPIIMITSRTADKHRNRAIELGVNEYMGKPYQEEQLLVLIRSYTKQRFG